MPVKIVTDSTCDLPAALVAEYDITVVPCYINVGGQSYLDGVEMSRAAFYEQLPRYDTVPTTSAPGIGTFIQTYEELATQGVDGVVSVHVSASLSNISNVARLAAEAIHVIPVTVVDSEQLTLGTGLLALVAAKAAAAGASMAEVLTLTREKVTCIHSFAALDTLEFLRRSGRVSQLQFSLGTWLKIKPLMKMHDGKLTLERVRTRRRSIRRMIQLASELGPLEELALVHTHAPERAEALRQSAKSLFPQDSSPLCAEVTPAIGAHVGPGAVGLVCVTAKTLHTVQGIGE